MCISFYYNKSTSKKHNYYAFDIRKNIVHINDSIKSIIILTNKLTCSACVKHYSKILKPFCEGDNKLQLSVIMPGASNAVLSNKYKIDFFKSVFPYAEKFLLVFDDFKKRKHNGKKIIEMKQYKEYDFPVVMIIDNSENLLKVIKFNEMAVENIITEITLLNEKKIKKDDIE